MRVTWHPQPNTTRTNTRVVTLYSTHAHLLCSQTTQNEFKIALDLQQLRLATVPFLFSELCLLSLSVCHSLTYTSASPQSWAFTPSFFDSPSPQKISTTSHSSLLPPLNKWCPTAFNLSILRCCPMQSPLPQLPRMRSAVAMAGSKTDCCPLQTSGTRRKHTFRGWFFEGLCWMLCCNELIVLFSLVKNFIDWLCSLFLISFNVCAVASWNELFLQTQKCQKRCAMCLSFFLRCSCCSTLGVCLVVWCRRNQPSKNVWVNSLVSLRVKRATAWLWTNAKQLQAMMVCAKGILSNKISAACCICVCDAFLISKL